MYLCDGCLIVFNNKKNYDTHLRLGCGKKSVIMPTLHTNKLKFTNIHKQVWIPFVIYCDFESILFNDNNSSSPLNINTHIPCSFAYYIHCNYSEELCKFYSYRGEDCVKKFIDTLRENVIFLAKILHTNIEMEPMSESQEIMFLESTVCHICKKELKDDRVRDHCHLTGKYRGAAHYECNIKFKVPYFIPVIFHNLSGYDSHLFIKELGSLDIDLSCIAKNKENYITFSMDFTTDDNDTHITVRFIDSYKFLSSSLDTLVKTLTTEQFKIVKKFLTSHEMPFVQQKGIYPYEYVNTWSRFEEEALPEKEAFFNTMTNKHISQQNYSQACAIWNKFNCKNLGEYSDLYLKIDVLLLADIFENFRLVCYETYNLDPCHYVSSPGLSFDAMLKYTQVELELFTEFDMLQFIKSGIRGGVCQVLHRYSKANNKYMPDYDPLKTSKYISYFDINSLYGFSMTFPLPQNQFRWLSEEETENFDINLINDQYSSTGYILEVDLEYPRHLHDDHNDFPFCAQPMKTGQTNVKKLVLNLNNKENYIIHYVNLRQCLANGLVLKKIHRILTFHQSCWLKSYVDLNIKKRQQATNDFEKDFYKLTINSVFGKTIENVEKRLDVKLLNHWDDKKTKTKHKYGVERLISQPNFKSCTIFSENLVAIQMVKSKVEYFKPIQVGFAILEISKTIMYDFHYNYMKSKYPQKLQLLYTDTDSLVYEIQTNDVFNDIKGDLSKFDTSNFKENNIYAIPRVNKKIMGLMKDEAGGEIIREFVGLRPKLYAYTIQDVTLENRNKRVKK